MSHASRVEQEWSLAMAVLAVLKAAHEHDFEITRTKLVKLLYFVDLDAVEEGFAPFTGAAWRWDHYGPFDRAYLRTEDEIHDQQLIWRQEIRLEITTHKIGLVNEIDDPLPTPQMSRVRSVVERLGAKRAVELKDLSYQTPPMLEAQAGGERHVLLDLDQARRAKKAKTAIARYKALRATMPERTSDPGAGDELLAELVEWAPLIRSVNTRELGDW